MHQLENGYTKIANSIIEALFKISVPVNSMRIILWIFRNSYGYHQKNTGVKSLREIARQINLSIGSAHCAISWLLGYKFLGKTQKGEYFIIKSNLTGVQPTEHPKPCKVFSPPNKSVQPTEHPVQPTEHFVQPTEHPLIIRKETLKKLRIKKERKAFTPPKIEEVQNYCKERKNQVNPHKWFNHYESNGWLVGRNKMKNWRASVRYWEHSEFAEQKNTGCAPIKGKYDGIGEKV